MGNVRSVSGDKRLSHSSQGEGLWSDRNTGDPVFLNFGIIA